MVHALSMFACIHAYAADAPSLFRELAGRPRTSTAALQSFDIHLTLRPSVRSSRTSGNAYELDIECIPEHPILVGAVSRLLRDAQCWLGGREQSKTLVFHVPGLASNCCAASRFPNFLFLGRILITSRK